MHRLLWIAALAACGGQPAPPDASFPHDGSPSTFTLTSPVLRDGARFADMNTCAGADTSPQLDWAGAPAGTQSFAVVLVNRSYYDQLHWVIYDVAAIATALPAGVEKAYAPANVAGAHQTTSYAQGMFGYLGPCTQFQDTYQITVYAIDVATLPGMTHDTAPGDASYIIDVHKLGYAGLLGTSSP
jgi:Raf kinase inhibitor-like YbhB/YbcL family protein